ncbi:hypothetical protein [Haliangium sp.]|uniref:hypothetical protein n=1 Tax=Haliangium sp. TaxID=2663208 RepID=UPI003D150978
MTELEAVDTLRGTDLIAVAQGSLAYIKEIQDKCLGAEIPALAARPDASCATGSCGTKLSLMVRSDDVPRVAALLQAEWLDLVDREGTGTMTRTAPAGEDESEELPCPACGTAAPLVEGACSDCGLQLA